MEVATKTAVSRFIKKRRLSEWQFGHTWRTEGAELSLSVSTMLQLLQVTIMIAYPITPIEAVTLPTYSYALVGQFAMLLGQDLRPSGIV